MPDQHRIASLSFEVPGDTRVCECVRVRAYMLNCFWVCVVVVVVAVVCVGVHLWQAIVLPWPVEKRVFAELLRYIYFGFFHPDYHRCGGVFAFAQAACVPDTCSLRLLSLSLLPLSSSEQWTTTILVAHLLVRAREMTASPTHCRAFAPPRRLSRSRQMQRKGGGETLPVPSYVAVVVGGRRLAASGPCLSQCRELRVLSGLSPFDATHWSYCDSSAQLQRSAASRDWNKIDTSTQMAGSLSMPSIPPSATSTSCECRCSTCHGDKRWPVLVVFH